MEEAGCCLRTWPLTTVFVGGITRMYLRWAAAWAVMKVSLSSKCFIPPKTNLFPLVWERLYAVLIAGFWRENYQCPNSWEKVGTAHVSMQACAFDQGMGRWGFWSFSEKYNDWITLRWKLGKRHAQETINALIRITVFLLLYSCKNS